MNKIRDFKAKMAPQAKIWTVAFFIGMEKTFLHYTDYKESPSVSYD